MITTSDTVILESGAIKKFAGPRIVCYPTYDPDTETANVDLSVRSFDGSLATHLEYYTMNISKATLNAQSISSTATVAIWMEAVEEAVKSRLESLNPSATFTIS